MTRRISQARSRLQHRWPRCALAVSFLTLAAPGFTAPADDSKAALRVLRDQCVACHKPGKAKGGLLLTSQDKMLAGGDSGTPVVAGKPEDSLLYQVLLADGDPHMPPKKQLAPREISAVHTWISAGAAWDTAVFDEAPEAKPVKLSTMPPGYHPVLALALSPDDKRLAVARANQVIILDLTQKERPVLAVLQAHTEAVQSLAWSPDGRIFASGGYQRMVIWDSAAWTRKHEIGTPLLGAITALAADERGHLFAADGEPGGAGFIRKIDAATGEILTTWKAHEDTVHALQVSAGGTRIVSGGADKLAKVWDATSGRISALYEGHTNHVLSVAFNATATQIATAGADREVKVWDVASREQDVAMGDRKAAFAALDWTPDGKALVAVTDKGTGSVYTDLKKHTGAQRSDTANQKKLNGVNDTLTCAAITADAKTVFAGGFSGSVHVWDAATGKTAGEIIDFQERSDAQSKPPANDVKDAGR